MTSPSRPGNGSGSAELVDEPEQEDLDQATQQALEGAFGAAAAAWLAAAVAVVLRGPGVPDPSLLPEAASFTADALARADAALRRVWAGTGLEDQISGYLRGLQWRLGGIPKAAWQKTTAALAHTPLAAGHADVDAARAAVRAALAPDQYATNVTRLADTEASIATATAAYNQAAQAAFATGRAVYKKWRTRRDNRVRETHQIAEGQEVAYDEAFWVGGVPMMHPGDPSAPASEVVNCRCRVDYRVGGRL